MSASTLSLLPMPLSPRMITPTPRMSTMLPISVPRGANIISSARVARLMNFIVTIGQRKIGTPRLLGGRQEFLVRLQVAGEDDAGDLVGEKMSRNAGRVPAGLSDFRKYASALPMTCTRLLAK